MARGTPTNPKVTVMRGLTVKLAPMFRRLFAELSRAQPAPATATQLQAELITQARGILSGALSKATYPALEVTDASQWPTSGEAWVYQPLCGTRNAEHARLPVSVQLAHVLNGSITAGGIYFPIEDLLVITEPGTGASEGTALTGNRLRVSTRTDLTTIILLLPMSSIDTAQLRIMEKADHHGFHTRKSGHPLFDAIDVASGRADAALLTRLTPLESTLAQLLVSEAGGTVTDLKGQKSTSQTTDLLLANPKLHSQLLPLLTA